MFVKKLVEKASSSKKPVGNSDGLKSTDIEPRLTFHYGIPSGANMFAYDPIQKIVAVSTRDGRIKLLGKDNAQFLLECPEPVPSKFLQFIQNKGILLNVTSKNHIEVWDLDKKSLSHVHVSKMDITAFAVMQHCLYMYVGDSIGNISVLKLDEATYCIEKMNYSIPFSASHGNLKEVSDDNAVSHILPQPTAESKRVLIVFRDGLITLWEIRDSRTIMATGGSLLQSQYSETKKVTSACWTCPFGSKVAVGYSNGDIFIWSIPATPNLRTAITSDSGIQSSPLYKLNLGYKSDKIPIPSLKWFHADGKASRLYVMGAADFSSTNLIQVVLLNENTETRTIKLGLHLSEPCIDMEIISSSWDQNKHKQECFLLLGKSGHVHIFDDCQIEKYLLQSQSRGSPSLPKEVMVTMPFTESNITTAKFIINNSHILTFGDEDYLLFSKNITSLFPFETNPKDGTHLNPVPFSGFSKVKNLYITGHSNGAIHFWDASCPILIPIFAIKQQSEDDFSLSGIALTALYFDGNSRILISGDHSGMVRIFNFKPEPYATENNFIPFQGSSKKGNTHIIQSVKLMKVNGSVLSVNLNHNLGHLAVGSDQGYVSLIDLKGPTLLYEKQIASEFSTGIISLQFETLNVHGFEKKSLVVATKDSSVLAVDVDTGNMMGTSTVHPKKPSKALFMQILDGQDTLAGGSNALSGRDPSKLTCVEDSVKQPSLLICSEKAVYVYSLSHVVQGVKKVHYKKKFHSSTCCWASTFYSASDVGLVLLFTTGKIELRSLPDLSLIKEFSVRGFTYSAPKLNTLSDNSICCSQDGEIVMVNGDQEMFIVSVLLQKEQFRLLDSFSQVYRKLLMPLPEGQASGATIQKEKKKGIFSSVIKGSSKSKQIPEVETEDTRESIEELPMIFSTANFALDADDSNTATTDADGIDLDIDDIDLDDPEEKPHKDQNILSAALNKQKLASKFQAFKGKIKQMKVKHDKNINKEEEHDEKAGTVDQIKKKYGFSGSSESSAAKEAESKLQENVKKLQGINLKATEMQDSAKTFSAMAKELLRTTEKDKRSS
ncbi:Transducin/WD40 repeat-like superfamily protein [Euphorbia peplus]|nr:Transducin/WD40 repeat-like superfamily protein [Euphorbia peplus]